MEGEAYRAKDLIAEIAWLTMSLTQGATAIIAPLSRGLAAKSSNRVFRVANFYDLATDWHGTVSLRLRLSAS